LQDRLRSEPRRIAEVQKVLDESVKATRAKDIDRYMQSIPADIAMQDKESGKAKSKADVRRDSPTAMVDCQRYGSHLQSNRPN
jgi:ketosteroid isomerase-like protein